MQKYLFDDACFCMIAGNIVFIKPVSNGGLFSSRATALKPTHEAGRRGGDSIARRHVFNYQN